MHYDKLSFYYYFQVIKVFTMVEITLHAGSKSALQYEVCARQSCNNMDLSYNINIIGQDQPNPLDLTRMHISDIVGLLCTSY